MARLTDRTLAELEDIALLKGAKPLDPAAMVRTRDRAAALYFANLVLEVRERRSRDREIARLANVDSANDVRSMLDWYRKLRLDNGGGLFPWEEHAVTTVTALLDLLDKEQP